METIRIIQKNMEVTVIDPKFRIALLSNNAKVPTLGSPGAAGYDLYAAEECLVHPENRALVSTDIAVEVPIGYYARIAPRSGLACKGVTVDAGVVDADYRGTVKVLLVNHKKVDPYHVKKGDRIAQMILEKILTLEIEVVDSLGSTERGTGGFGSTGQ